MAVCCESGDANKNVSNAQRSIRVAALPYGGPFFYPCVACCRGCNDSDGLSAKQKLSQNRFLFGNFYAFLSRLGETNGDRLFAALDFASSPYHPSTTSAFV